MLHGRGCTNDCVYLSKKRMNFYIGIPVALVILDYFSDFVTDFILHDIIFNV